MKITKYVAFSAMALGLLTACNKETAGTDGQNQGKATTFAGLTISTPGLRADDGQNEETGTTQESTLEKINLLSSVADQSWDLGAQDAEGKFWKVAEGYKVAPWKTQAGPQTMALMLNGTIAGFTDLNAGVAADYVFGGADGAAEADITALATESKFVMTSAVAAKTVADGKKAEEVKDATGEANNVFSFDAERVVAKGIVKKGAALAAATKDGKGTIDLATLKYAPENTGAKTFLFANKAGDRQMTGKKYGTFQSAIHSATSAATADLAKTAGLIRLGNIGAAATTGKYKAVTVGENTIDAKGAGFYFMENSVADLAAAKATGFYRLAYAKVYAKFTPTEVLKLNGTTLVKGTSADLTDGTFYKGETDGLLYATKAAAEASKTAPGQKVFVYKNGMCGYRVLWNRTMNADGKTVENADVRRNNIYVLTIKEIAGLGMPWDSSDITDPNLPKDPNDNSTTKPDDPNIEKQDTYMRVEAKILPWNVVSREVILE